jgi:hypothetical protein
MFLVLGCFLDVSVLLLVFVPMLLPAVKLLGIDLVHFGVLVVLNMMIGLIHPPFGMLLFVTKALTGIPIGEMMKEGLALPGDADLLLLAMTAVPADRAVAAADHGLRRQVVAPCRRVLTLDPLRQLRGIVPSMNTPFLDDGSVDLDSIGRTVEAVIGAGVAGMLILAVAGETGSLSPRKASTGRCHAAARSPGGCRSSSAAVRPARRSASRWRRWHAAWRTSHAVPGARGSAWRHAGGPDAGNCRRSARRC